MSKSVEYLRVYDRVMSRSAVRQRQMEIVHLCVLGWKGTRMARPFSADQFYATEEEADIQGIAFGQRIIDGNLDGVSVG